MASLLIVGGTGFVGRAVLEAALARGHRITLLNRGSQPLPGHRPAHRRPRPAGKSHRGGGARHCQRASTRFWMANAHTGAQAQALIDALGEADAGGGRHFQSRPSMRTAPPSRRMRSSPSAAPRSGATMCADMSDVERAYARSDRNSDTARCCARPIFSGRAIAATGRHGSGRASLPDVPLSCREMVVRLSSSSTRMILPR